MMFDAQKKPLMKVATCPSSRCHDGAVLLGVVQSDGVLSFARERIVIDNDFVVAAHTGRMPEKRFRFASRCHTKACIQWKDEQCSVINRLIQTEPREPLPILPECSIRTTCRWLLQNGDSACSICPEVITELGT